MKKLYIGSLLALCVLVCFGCQNIKALHLEKDTSLPFTLSKEERDILYYASLAPNAHNSQPWALYYHQGSQTFTLVLDKGKALPHTDPTNRESYISLGAFLENFTQVASASGFRADMEIKATPSAPEEIARIRLTRLESAPTTDTVARLALMEQRHTDKRPYADVPIPHAAIQDLLDRHKPYLSYYPKGTQGYLYLSDRAVRAMQTQSEDQSKRDELASWLRFSNEEARAARDGLPAEQLSMTGMKKFFYYLLYSREKTRGDAFARESVLQVAEQVDNCAGFFVITGGDTLPEYVRAGMQLEALWLDAVAAGISIHPLSQMLEEEPYKGEVQNALELALPPQMVLRAGVLADYGKNHKIRRNIADFVQAVE